MKFFKNVWNWSWKLIKWIFKNPIKSVVAVLILAFLFGASVKRTGEVAQTQSKKVDSSLANQVEVLKRELAEVKASAGKAVSLPAAVVVQKTVPASAPMRVIYPEGKSQRQTDVEYIHPTGVAEQNLPQMSDPHEKVRWDKSKMMFWDVRWQKYFITPPNLFMFDVESGKWKCPFDDFSDKFPNEADMLRLQAGNKQPVYFNYQGIIRKYGPQAAPPVQGMW